MTAALSTDDFNFIAGLLKQRSGLALTPDKGYLIETRLQPVAKASGLNDVRELIGKLRASPPLTLVNLVVESMTTNESMFFRDMKPFDVLVKHLLPQLKAQNRMNLRIWSAACSTGQEPYSIAMALKEEAVRYPGLTFEIIATDLAGKVLDSSREGIYSQFEVQRGLPIQYLMKYFAQAPNNMWKIQDALKQNIKFQAGNLLESFSALGRFDIIFCRNVLIYFDDKTKAEVLERMAAQMNPPGFLFLGGAESTFGLTSKYTASVEHRGMFTLGA